MKTSNAKSYTQLLIQAFWLKLDFPLRSSNQALGGEEEQQRATAAASSSPSQMGFFYLKSCRFLETSMASCAGMRAGYLCLSGEAPPAVPVKQVLARIKLQLTLLFCVKRRRAGGSAGSLCQRWITIRWHSAARTFAAMLIARRIKVLQ